MAIHITQSGFRNPFYNNRIAGRRGNLSGSTSTITSSLLDYADQHGMKLILISLEFVVVVLGCRKSIMTRE